MLRTEDERDHPGHHGRGSGETRTGYEVKDNVVNVQVGSVEHPMVEEHYIEWIDVQTSQGYQHKVLNPGDKPQASFALAEGETVEAVYAYCNLHGLWKA